MAEFTKEQLVGWANILIEETHTDISISRTDAHAESYRAQLALLEIALAALMAEPFMYAIVAPEGEAYFDECCVSGGKSDLSEIVSNLNDQCESPGEEYTETPLYRLPLLEGLK